MGETFFKGPLRGGTILKKTGTRVGADVANVGDMVLTQTDTVAYTDTTAKDLQIVIPKQSQIADIKVLVETGFNNVSALDGKVLDVGVSGGADDYFVNGLDLTRNSGSDLQTGYILIGPAGVVGNWSNTGSTDIRLTGKFINGGSSPTSGLIRINVYYIQGNDLTDP